jgi:hypothetical protein
MSLYSEYYFSSQQIVAELDLIEIEHPRFNPTVFRLVRNIQYHELSTTDVHGNPKVGVIVMHEGAVGPFEYEYMPMTIERISANTDMDQALRITVGDLGSVIPEQLDLIDQFNANSIKPIVRYRAYRSDDFTTPLTESPVICEIKRISFTKQGCSFEAIAPYLNTSSTGIRYDTKTFPTMSAFFKNG